MLPWQSVMSTSIRMFQYRLLNNIVYFNKCLYKKKLVESLLCSQCTTVDDHDFFSLFSACPVTLHIWEELTKCCLSLNYMYISNLSLCKKMMLCLYVLLKKISFKKLSFKRYPNATTIMSSVKYKMYMVYKMFNCVARHYMTL